MNILIKKILLFAVPLLLLSCTSHSRDENILISIKTTFGEIKIKLYNGTPLHRDNFIKLVNTGFYENISFHRVIKDFMIQAGDPATKTGYAKSFPDSIISTTIPAEFTPRYFHKKGALAAAREGNEQNPQMRSSGTQFYLVQGIKFNDEELNQAELRINSNIKQALFNRLIKETSDSIRQTGKMITDGEIQEIASVKMFEYLTASPEYKISEEQRIIYKNIGGVPRLDGTYTVFGEVIEGLDVVDRIAFVPTDSNDKPVSEIKILKMKIINK